jgi:DNA-binding CsgD family transcriptional regulator/PAS domain-containing protein
MQLAWTLPHPPQRDAAALSALAERIYDAALRPERWHAAVAAVAHSFRCGKALLFTPYVAPHDGGLAIPSGIAEEALQQWASSYIEHDVWSRALASRGPLRAGTVLIDEQLVPEAEFVQSRIYTEFLSGVGIGRVCAGLVVGNEAGLTATSLAVFRGIDEPPFDAADIEWMSMLAAHVSRSLRLMQRLDMQRLQQAALQASFDRVGFGVVLLDAGMRVVHVNAAARRVFDRQDGLAIGPGRQLESTLGGCRHPRLSQWLDALRNMPPPHHGQCLDGCHVPRKANQSHYREVNQLHYREANQSHYREANQSHYVVQCAPLASQEGWRVAGSELHYVAFITDPAALKLPRAEQLVQLYSLTHMQARVALEFAGGASYKDVARSLGISEETVRSHVKELYPKTRVNRQADLVRLILSLGQSAI